MYVALVAIFIERKYCKYYYYGDNIINNNIISIIVIYSGFYYKFKGFITYKKTKVELFCS